MPLALQGKDIAGVSEEVLTTLTDYDYPGNVRELENIIEQSFVLCRGGVIESRHLPMELRSGSASIPSAGQPAMSLKAMEKHYITETLKRYDGNRSLSAKALGIDMSTLYRKIKSLNITPPSTDGRHRRQ